MRKVIAFLAMSLDGCIADADNHIDWLTTFPSPAGEDFGYAKLLEEVDTLVMGRKPMILSFSKVNHGLIWEKTPGSSVGRQNVQCIRQIQ